MKRRSVDLFGVSFIDLMAGALGAVLILFIIIPKVSIEQYQEMKRIKNLGGEISLIIESLVSLEHFSRDDVQKEVLKKLVELNGKIQAIQNEAWALAAKIRSLEEKVTNLDRVIAMLKDQAQKVQQAHQKEVSSLKETIALREKAIQSEKSHDVGFQFKGRKILFVIDVSGSMDESDKLGQVKAGLKFLMSMMTSNYQVAVLVFPDVNNNGDCRPLWHGFRVMDDFHRRVAAQDLLRVSAHGGTPTRFAMREAFRLWPDATDIVLLTDGKPMLHRNSQVGDPGDDIHDLVNELTGLNRGRMAIHTIGVGPDFAGFSPTPAVVFLRDLARRNNGHYSGF